MPRHCWQQGGLGYGRPRLRLGRGRLSATRTRAGRRPSGCAAVADTAAQPPQRRCNLAKLAGPPRQRSPTLPWSKPQQRLIAQLHSPRSSDHRRHKCRIDSIEIYSRVLNSKLRSRSWVRPQVRPAVGCAAVAPLCRCIAGGSAAAGAAATGISLGRAGRVAAPPSRSLIRPLRLGRAAVAAAAAAPRRLETAQRLAARHASGV